jgi:arylsulfatase A-like enzyme
VLNKLLYLGSLLALLAAGFGTPAPATPHNVIFVLCDDLGIGDIGVFFQNSRKTNNLRSEPWHLTPHLDSLASEGMQLRRHYTAAPVCAPARASLLLGVHQGHANVRDNQFDKALEQNHNLATTLKAAGYATAAIGKWGLQGGGGSPAAWPAYPTKRGFDYYYGYVRHGDGHTHYPFHTTTSRPPKPLYDGDTEISSQLENCYTVDLFTARAKKWIVDHHTTQPDQPFFLYLAYDTPHAATQIPTTAYPAGGGTNGGVQWLGVSGQMINTAVGPIDSYYHPDYVGATWDHDNNPATAEVAWPDVYKRYATMVRRMDDALGDIVTLLKQLNQDTNTLIVFTSDNGPSQESYLPQSYDPSFFNSFGPHDGIKRDTWEGGIRVGAIVRAPGLIPPQQIDHTPTSFWDWLPTFAELAGLPAPARSDGVSLLPLLQGQPLPRQPLVYVEYFQNGSTPNYSEFWPAHRNRTRRQMQVLYEAGYKGLRYDITAAATPFEIYDTLADPQETNNLALTPAFASWQQKLQDRVLQVRRPDSSAPRPYDATPVPALTGNDFTNGVLNYSVYEGSWPWVPEFASLPTVKTGSAAGVDLSVRSRDTDFGIAYTGYLTIPIEGSYTFYLTSDSGAHFRLHEATVIDDDYNHTGSEVSGTIRLQAGRHPFRLYYRHGSGNRILNLQYSGPCLEKQPVPQEAFALPGSPDPRPQAIHDCIRTAQNTPVLIPVLANDRDDGLPAPLQVLGVTTPQAGTTSVTNQQVLYTPNPGFLGEDSFTYQISDGQSTSMATVNVTVFFSTNEIWLPLNQVSGHETTDAGGGISATLHNFPTDTDHWVAGRWNRAVLLDGISQYLSIGSGYLPPGGNSARTTAAWIKTTGAGSIIAWGPNSTSRKWHMRLENGTTLTGALRVEIGGGFVRGTKDLRDDQWHHVASVLPGGPASNSTNILLYVDGTLEPLSEVSTAPINTDVAVATIGVDSQDRYFPGTIDEVRIFSRALSAAEIASEFQATHRSAAAWHYRHFGAAPVQWTMDDDLDGGIRLLEYGFGAQPHLADAPQMKLRAVLVDNFLQVDFPRRLSGTTELQYQAQVSPDLVEWNSLSATQIASVASSQMGFEQVTYRTTTTVQESSPLYLRVNLSLP